MLALNKIDDMCFMWVARPRLDTEHVCISFHRVLVFRDNINLDYSFGLVETIRVWPISCTDMYETTLAMRLTSVTTYHDMLST